MRSCISQCMAKADWYPRSALDAVWHLISNTRMIYDLQIKVIAMSCAPNGAQSGPGSQDVQKAHLETHSRQVTSW